jgi:hypothetical protein
MELDHGNRSHIFWFGLGPTIGVVENCSKTSSITFVLRVEYSGSKRTIKQMWNTLEEKSAQGE